MDDAHGHYKLRTAVYNLMYQWDNRKSDPNTHPRALAQLLGRKRSFFHQSMTEDEIADCEKLLGPHGYAYYRVLLVRSGA